MPTLPVTTDGGVIGYFWDDFNRADSLTVGNGWGQGYAGYPGNQSYAEIVSNKLRIHGYVANESWCYHAQGATGKIKLGVTLKYVGKAIFITLNADTSQRDGYGLVITTADDSIYIIDRTTGILATGSFTFVTDGSIVYRVELEMNYDGHMAVYIWDITTSRPSTPTIEWNNSGAPYTPIADGTNIMLEETGNGVYTDFDDVITENLPASAERITTDGIVLEQKEATFTTDGIVAVTREATITTDAEVVLKEFFTTDGIVHEPTLPSPACRITSSNYKWMTNTLLTAQQKYNVRPFYKIKVVDDSVVPDINYGIWATQIMKGTMVPAPDGSILAVGEIMSGYGGTTGNVGFWKITDGTIPSQWTTPTAVLDVAPSLPPILQNYGIYSIAVSEYIGGTYRIDVYYFINFTGDGSTLKIRHQYSDDGGTTWNSEDPIDTGIANNKIMDLDDPLNTNFYLSAGKPFRKTDGTITSTVFFLKRKDLTAPGKYTIVMAKSDTGSGVFTQTLMPTETVDSNDWYMHSLDVAYKSGVFYIVFSGYHTKRESVNTSALRNLGNLSLYTTAIRDIDLNVWDYPYEVFTTLSSSGANYNAYFNPKLTYDSDREMLYLTFAYASVEAVASSAQNSTVIVNYGYMFAQSKDLRNFTYPTQVLFTDGTAFVPSGTADVTYLNVLVAMQNTFCPQGDYFFMGAGSRFGYLWQYKQNNIVADISNDVLQYAIQESAGSPSNITVQIGNQDGKWVGPTPTMPGNTALAKNKKVLLYQGFYNAIGDPETAPKNIFYIDDIRQSVTASTNELIITARDWYKKLKTTVTKFAFSFVGPKFYYDPFDGTTLGNWLQKKGTWEENAGILNATAPLVNDIITPQLQDPGQGGVLLLNNSISPSCAYELSVSCKLSNPAVNNKSVIIYLYWEDSDNWIRLRVSTVNPGPPSFFFFVESMVAGAEDSHLVATNHNLNWNASNDRYAIHIRKHHNNTFDFCISSNITTGVPLVGGNNERTWNPGETPHAAEMLFSATLDTQNFADTKTLTSLGMVGLGYDNWDPEFSNFKFIVYGNSNNIEDLMRAVATKAGIFDYKPEQIFDDRFFDPVPYTGTFTTPNRVLTIANGNVVTRDTITIDNGEIEFDAKIDKDPSTTQYGFRVYFRTSYSNDTYCYVWELVRQTSGKVISQFKIRIAGVERVLYENTPYDYVNANTPNEVKVDLTKLHNYKLVFSDSFMYAFVDDLMISAWSDTNSTQVYTAGGLGFSFVSNGPATDRLKIKKVTSGAFWNQIPSITINPGDDMEQAVDQLVHIVRGWNFSDLFGRFKSILLHSTDPSAYTYQDQLYAQNTDNSDKEYANQVTVYGSGVSATAKDEESIGQNGIREHIVVDYKITTMSDAQERADFELINIKKFILQSRPSQTNNVGAEVFDVATVVNTGPNSANTDFPVRVYSQMQRSTGSSEYTLEIDTGAL